MPDSAHEHTQRKVETPLRRVKGRVPTPVKSAVRESAIGYGRLTASRRPPPDFIVIGTKRGGTTSLWYALSGHPDVLPMYPSLQQAKSPHYFDLNYGKGMRWYRAHFPTARQRSSHEKRTGVTPLSGEASPYYMFHPLAAERIARDLPEVKLIVSLRNPVDRIWSHYRERVGGADATETLSFRDALDAEEDRLAGEADRIISESPGYNSFHHDFSSYLARGRYAEHLRPFVGLFSGRLLVLRAEDYYENENRELTKISDFLGLPPYPKREVTHFNQMPPSSLPDEDRQFLTEYYRPHVAELEEMLGRRMRWSDFSA